MAACQGPYPLAEHAAGLATACGYLNKGSQTPGGGEGQVTVKFSFRDRKSVGNEGGSGWAALIIVKEDVSVSLVLGGSGPFGVQSLPPCLSSVSHVLFVAPSFLPVLRTPVIGYRVTQIVGWPHV